jgi:hypothetical protein
MEPDENNFEYIPTLNSYDLIIKDVFEFWFIYVCNLNTQNVFTNKKLLKYYKCKNVIDLKKLNFFSIYTNSYLNKKNIKDLEGEIS